VARFFEHNEAGWSPIQVLVTAAVAYSQTRCVIVSVIAPCRATGLTFKVIAL